MNNILSLSSINALTNNQLRAELRKRGIVKMPIKRVMLITKLVDLQQTLIMHVANWEQVLTIKTPQLNFIHTPKCGGTYIRQILTDLNIHNNHHNQSDINDTINFTVIRHPVDRFESMLNYRLGRNSPLKGGRLKSVRPDTTLDEIVSNMTDKHILTITPFRTLVYWCTNVDVIITMKHLHPFLNFMGYKYDGSKYPFANVSNKTHGTFNNTTIARLSVLFRDDIDIYNKWR